MTGHRKDRIHRDPAGFAASCSAAQSWGAPWNDQLRGAGGPPTTQSQPTSVHTGRGAQLPATATVWQILLQQPPAARLVASRADTAVIYRNRSLKRIRAIPGSGG